MQTIGATEARANLASLLRRVSEQGERIAIQRRGKPRVVLVPVEDLEWIESGGKHALCESGARLRAIMDHAPMEIYLKDAEGRYAQINQHYEKKWGTNNEEIQGKLPGDVHQENHAMVSRAHDLAVLESGEVIEREDNVQLDDGLHSLHMIKFPVRDAAGEIAGLGGIVIDFTDRKRVEAALRENEALLRQATEMVGLGHWVWDEVADRCIYCSEMLAQMNGVTVEEYPARFDTMEALLKDVHPDDRARYEQVIRDAKRDAVPYDIEFRDAMPGGGFRYLRELGEPILDDEGKVVRAMGTIQDITDYKRTEEALREGEQRFKDFVDASSDWFWEMDENCRFSYFSARFTEVTGVPHEALLGKTREETEIPGVDLEVWQRHLDDLAARRSFRDFRHPRTCPDGRVVQLSINGKAVFDRAGNFKGYRGTGTDITESMQTEERLRKTNALFNETERLARLGHWEWDEIEDSCVYCSEELARMHGITVEEFLQRATSFEADLDSIHPEDRERYYQVVTEATQRRKGFEIECRLLQPNGDVLDVREVAEPVLDQQGTLIRSIGFVQDISGRKRTEQALRESEGRFRGVFDLGLIGMAVLSPAGHFQQVNRAYCKFLGYSKDELIGKHFNQVIHPDDLESVAMRLRQLLAGEVEGYHHERRYRHKNGHDIWGLAGLFVLRNPDGSPQDFVVQVLGTTERRRAEEALRESEAALTRAQRQAKIGSWRRDVPGNRLISCSKEYARIHGVKTDKARALLEEQMKRVIHPDDRERVESERKRFDEEGLDYEIEYRIVRPDGKVRHVQEIGEAVFDRTGRTTEQFGTIQDITEFKRIEEELRQARVELEQRVAERTAELGQSEARLRAIMDHAPVEIGLKDTEGCYLLVSRQFEQRYGLKSESVSGKFPGDIFPPEAAARVTAHDKEVLTSGQVMEREMHDVIDGQTHTYLAVKFPVRDGNQHIFGVGAMAIDITERKRAEDELRESERRYRELFDESPVAIWEEDWSALKQMLDDLARGGVEDWRDYFNIHRDQLKTAYGLAEIIEISRAAIDLYREESKEEIVRKSAAAVVIDEELDAFHETVLSFLAGQMTVDIESKDMAGDGSEIIVRRRVVIPPKYRDDWSRVIYAIEDITERARVEEQLRQARKMEAVGQLTGGVAHDFNNLLAVIMGNAELLSIKAGETDPKIEAVIRAATRGAELTGRLLAFSREQTLQPQAVELNALVGGMTDLLGRTLGETIEITTSAAPGLWRAEVDPGQLENALLNLAINARDAMPGGGTLMIETGNFSLDEAYAANHPDFTPGDYVTLAVSDNGSGMSPEVLEHALEPFFTTKDVGEGSGLGLSMVYGFAKQSGGHIAIHSEEGHGTTVKLYLPRTQSEAEQSEQANNTEEPRARGETVLVVEDDADVRQLAVAMLEDLGYQVLQAPDGWAALLILEESAAPDLLLSDVVLPRGLSGPTLAEEIKREHPPIKVLFMSGYAEYAAGHNHLAAAGAKLINKPFRKHELALKVRGVLDR